MKLEFAANHEGAMLAVFAPPGVANRIAIPGGEPADDLHVTLFYFGDNADLGEYERKLILDLTAALTAEYPGLDVLLHGTEVFEENDERPLVARVWSPTLETFRLRLATALDLAGIRYSKEHEYKPHLTLKYLNQEAAPVSRSKNTSPRRRSKPASLPRDTPSSSGTSSSARPRALVISPDRKPVNASE
jgi:2'-5' RNA ligase